MSRDQESNIARIAQMLADRVEYCVSVSLVYKSAEKSQRLSRTTREDIESMLRSQLQ